MKKLTEHEFKDKMWEMRKLCYEVAHEIERKLKIETRKKENENER